MADCARAAQLVQVPPLSFYRQLHRGLLLPGAKLLAPFLNELKMTALAEVIAKLTPRWASAY
jgi:hypothetical protein